MSNPETLPFEPTEAQPPKSVSDIEALPSIAERNDVYAKPDHGRTLEPVHPQVVGHQPPGGHVEMNPDVAATKRTVAWLAGDRTDELETLRAIRAGTFEAGDDEHKPAQPAPSEPQELKEDVLDILDIARADIANVQDPLGTVDELVPPDRIYDGPPVGEIASNVARRVDSNGIQPGERTAPTGERVNPPFKPQRIIRRSDPRTDGPAGEAVKALGKVPSEELPPPPEPRQPAEYPSYHPITRRRNEKAGGEFYEDF